ncbi:MAG: TraR/DksA C4-type zinc finger protein [Minisyncoccota bacterium]
MDELDVVADSDTICRIMTVNLEYLKKKLEEEKTKIETELSRVAVKDPGNSSNWEPQPPVRDTSSADENTAADSIEDYEENNAITVSLESRLNDIRSGLDKIEKGTYGTCQICNKEIEDDRLEANPAARTCKEHINSL